MPTYDLKSLSAYDFEILIRDLLQEELNVTLESFIPGRDKGIDIRFSRNKKNTIIIQCKHYVNSKISDLMHTLSIEKYKIDLLKPGRYIIATSLGVNPATKDKIDKLLYPHIKNLSDIVDIEGINNLIRKYPKVERLHYKLWLTSSEVLKLILYNPIYNRSRIDREMIIQKSKVYVQNKSYGRAIKVLGKYSYCIISGVPGIGKTTLAEILCLKYMSRGFELISIATNIEDAYKMLDEDKKQIFYFDDFLGSTFLEDRLKDNALIKFISYITTFKNKRFILTTREYILQQAINLSEGYARAQLKKCIVKQEEYTNKIKAYILYNHLFFSGLEEEYLQTISKNQTYLPIIKHENYCPRIIEWMTNALNVRNIPAKDYGRAFLSALENPKIIWKIAFEHHLKPYSRSIVTLMGMLYDNISLNDFAVLLKNWANGSDTNVVEWNIIYRNALKELDGTFIKIEHPSDDIIRFHNHSIKDFIIDYIRNENELALSYLRTELIYWDQFCLIINILKKNSNRFISEIIDTINRLLDNIYIPTLEIESIYGNSLSKINKTMFKRLRYILETVNDIDKSLLEEIYEKIIIYVKNETKTDFVANIDTYLVFYEINLIKDREYFVEEKEIILKRINNSETYEELNELYDIYRLLSEEPDEVSALVEKKFMKITSEFEIDEDLSNLRKAEDLISEITEKLKIDIPKKADEVREKIIEIEREESEKENDYDEDAMKEMKERHMSEKKELLEIDQMFNCLKR